MNTVVVCVTFMIVQFIFMGLFLLFAEHSNKKYSKELQKSFDREGKVLDRLQKALS